MRNCSNRSMAEYGWLPVVALRFAIVCFDRQLTEALYMPNQINGRTSEDAPGETCRSVREDQPVRPLAIMFTNQGQRYTPDFDDMDDDIRCKSTTWTSSPLSARTRTAAR